MNTHNNKIGLSTSDLIRSDFYRYTAQTGGFLRMLKVMTKNHCFAYNVWLRLAASENKIISVIGRIGHRALSARHDIQISRKCAIGPGFYIGHGVSIVVSPSAKFGENCNISQMTTIGSNQGQAATIGNNVYIGPNVCIVENIIVGDNATIGAGSVVVKDVPENATVVGNPARIINYENPGRFIGNRYPD